MRGAKPKVYPTEMVERVRELYAQGLTQSEIAVMVGTSQKVVWRLMVRHSITARVAGKRDQRGPKNSSWKGDQASYSALHLRVTAARGAEKRCDVCGTSDPKRQYDWANLTGNYADIWDYKRMCRSCHWKHDGKVYNIRWMRCA